MTLPHIIIALVIWCTLSAATAVFIAGVIAAADQPKVRGEDQSHKGAMQHD